MRLTLKMNYDKAEALSDLLDYLLGSLITPENIEESLIMDLMAEVAEKLRRKLVSDYAKNYNVSLSPIQAKAYYIFFKQYSPLCVGFTYELNIVTQHLTLIHQHYGHSFKAKNRNRKLAEGTPARRLDSPA